MPARWLRNSRQSRRQDAAPAAPGELPRRETVALRLGVGAHVRTRGSSRP